MASVMGFSAVSLSAIGSPATVVLTVRFDRLYVHGSDRSDLHSGVVEGPRCAALVLDNLLNLCSKLHPLGQFLVRSCSFTFKGRSGRNRYLLSCVGAFV